MKTYFIFFIAFLIIAFVAKKLGFAKKYFNWDKKITLNILSIALKQKKTILRIVIFIVIVIGGGIAIKHFSKYQFNGERRSSSSGSSSYEHSCGHCGEGFNGGGYIGSYPNIIKVSSSEIESYPAHYCSKRCAIAD